MAEFGQLTPYILHWEGGLVSVATDSASHDPSPAVDWADVPGQRKKGMPIHTNKGVTWAAFRDNAARLGYRADTEIFLAMPADIWCRINRRYWDAVKGDRIRHQSVANHLCDFGWGSGPGTAIKRAQWVLQHKFAEIDVIADGVMGPLTLKALNELPERELFEALYADRREFLLWLSRPGAKDEVYRQGWMNRMDYFHAWQVPRISG